MAVRPLFALLLASCTADAVSTAGEEILDGRPATAFKEAVLVNGPNFMCSGALVSPRVVVTAGHCVRASEYTVKAPFAGNQSALGHQTWSDYRPISGSVNPETNDVGVIVLDTPIRLSKYPKIADEHQAEGTKAINVGRMRNGRPSASSLFRGPEVALKDAIDLGYAMSYTTEQVVEDGDSGGPVYVGEGAQRTIVAVNSGAAGGIQILARTDLAHAKIRQLIAQTN